MRQILFFFVLLFFSPIVIFSQNNIVGKASIISNSEIRVRWSPSNMKSWMDGKKDGYKVERYTLVKEGVWQETPERIVVNKTFKPEPLANWESQALASDYTAVIAQAFYGEDFELNSSKSNMGQIVNQASELEQRFATSVFMAEYDYEGAKLAGWAWTDTNTNATDKYLYQVTLNRQQPVQGDTLNIFVSYEDKEELPVPINLQARWEDRSAILMWNYQLLSNTYHSYYIERKSAQEKEFVKIPGLPTTALDVNMQEVFFRDSLQSNDIEYEYRVLGINSFGQTGPPSAIVKGQGKKTISCIPYIINGDFKTNDIAELFWQFECESPELVDCFSIVRSDSIDGTYTKILGDIPVKERGVNLSISQDLSYVKIQVLNKDKSIHESYPLTLRKTDSIPPSIPSGLIAYIDTLGVAHLQWDQNIESDFMGYRILRSFEKGNEKSVITAQLIKTNTYTDSLSLALSNEKVFYSLTALDNRYNESEPCPEIELVKPNRSSLVAPRFILSSLSKDTVVLAWMVDRNKPNIIYTLHRKSLEDSKRDEIIYKGDYQINEFKDNPTVSGEYEYMVVATDGTGKQSESPQKVSFRIDTDSKNSIISNFKAYVNLKDRYIELSWKKHSSAILYRIYKSEVGQPPVIWKELDATQSRVIDQYVSPDSQYVYTILFRMKNASSQAQTITVNY